MTILTYGVGDRQNDVLIPFLDRSDGHPSVSQIHSYIRNLRSYWLQRAATGCDARWFP